jgi:AraC family transcriptional regulator
MSREGRENGTHDSRPARTTLAQGSGWSVEDVVCSLGPEDRPFEESHSGVSIALVVAGTFQYRSSHWNDMLTPGSLLLGNAGQCFECGHEHASGDRCVAFHFDAEFFGEIAADLGVRETDPAFRRGRVPPIRAITGLSARVSAGLLDTRDTAWEELGLELAGRVLWLTHDLPNRTAAIPRRAAARVTDSVRGIERNPAANHTVQSLAREVGLSRFHYLRTFEQVTGVTPHQYLLRTRLRAAAIGLMSGSAKIVAIAFDAGFNDLSNFNRMFRAEFGVSPSRYRTTARSVPQSHIPLAGG